MSTAEARSLRVVLDTNVYVSAFTQPQSRLFGIWRAALRRRYTLLTSPDLVNEISRVLRSRFEWNDPLITRRMKLLTHVAEVIAPKITLHEIQNDEADNRILECAVAGKADLIISGDQHLTHLKVFQQIAIVRPVDFCRTLGI